MSKTRFVSGLTALAVIALVASPASAGWFHRHHGGGGGWGGSSGGSSGGWGGSSGGWGGSSGGGSSGGWWGSYGYGGYSCGSSGGGGWGSSGGSSGGVSYGSSGGWSSGYGGGVMMDGGVEMAAPSDSGSPPPAPENPGSPPPAPADDGNAPAGRGVFRMNSTLGTLAVRVPADAKVFVNGLETTSTGTVRQYASRNLRPGSSYNYEVRAEVIRDGQPVTETKTATLTAGSSAELAFNLASEKIADQNSAETSLTVRLPADAKLYLAGRETRATGAVRQFSTNNLTSGRKWASYTVRATVDRDGKTVTREEKITIKAGEKLELTLNFDEPADQIASTRTN